MNKTFESEFTYKIERLQYQGLLGQPGNIKFEVDHHQNVVPPGVKREYQNVWRVDAAPLVLDQVELCAEKIRATSQRARYRDFYDRYFLMKKLWIDLKRVLRVLERKEIRTPIIAANIARNWEIAKEQKVRDLGSIYCSEDVNNDSIEAMIGEIEFEDLT